jgi:hypothetical protein
MRKVLLALAGLAIGAAAVITTLTPLASGSPTPDNCTKERGTISCVTVVPSTPHRNWSQVESTSVKGNFDSSHDPVEDNTVKNPSGKEPPGQQQP